MNKYNFYYDESEHSRKINLRTIESENYYDNFIAVIVGWKTDSEADIYKKYAKFEEKYAYRKSRGELKSQTLRQKDLINGFASMNRKNVSFLLDYLSIFDNDTSIYIATVSKLEYIISQLLSGYKKSSGFNINEMKYSIVKSILVYQPKEIIEGLFENSEELLMKLIDFFEKRIRENRANIALKQREIEAYMEILFLLKDIQRPKSIDWNYDIAFYGFKKYLEECRITDYTLSIDKEGDGSNTLNAAKRIGIENAEEVDSKESIGVRISDMLAGIISKLLKALHNALEYKSQNEYLKKKLLDSEWFILREDQLLLYKELYKVVLEINNRDYKIYSGEYSDDLLVLLAFLRYMNDFSSANEIEKQNIDMKGDYFNAYVCSFLEKHFERMKKC